MRTCPSLPGPGHSSADIRPALTLRWGIQSAPAPQYEWMGTLGLEPLLSPSEGSACGLVSAEAAPRLRVGAALPLSPEA